MVLGLCLISIDLAARRPLPSRAQSPAVAPYAMSVPESAYHTRRRKAALTFTMLFRSMWSGSGMLLSLDATSIAYLSTGHRVA
eukprot:62864-Rhodomonas_salina.6